MNVLLVSREFPPSGRSAGIGSYTKELAEGLAMRQHRVVVLTASDDTASYSVERTGNIVIIREPGGDFFTGNAPIARAMNRIRSTLFYNSYRRKLAVKINQIISEYSIDIVELPEYGNEGKFWLQDRSTHAVTRFHGPTCLNRFTGELSPRNRRDHDEILSFQLTDAHSFVSRAMKATVHGFNQYGEMPHEVIHNGVRPELRRRSLNNIPSNRISIVGAGSIGAIKGWDKLISACMMLNQEENLVSLDLYGRQADLTNYIKKMIRSDKKCYNWLELHGAISREDLMDVYSRADLCCFPSWFEPFGLAPLEAMSMNSLVLASTRGAAPEFIEDGKNGFLVDPGGSVADFAAKIARIISLEEAAKERIRKNARISVENDVSFKAFIDQTIALYEKVINKS